MKTKAFTKKALALFLFLILIASCGLSLVSCGENWGGSRELLSKEELIANLQSEENEELDSCADYLDAWGFPRFQKSKLAVLERIYKNNFVEELADPLTKARSTAEIFLEKYYDKVDINDTAKTTDMLIYSYVATMGDKYSIYRTAEEYEDYDTDMSGSFVGIGVVVRYREDSKEIEVDSVNSDSGAELAGIKAGDYIIKVDGESIAELGYENAVSKIKGKEGTTVEITIRRGDEELSFHVARKRIIEESVKYEIKDNIGYIKITGFKENTYSQFKKAIDAIVEAGAEGIIYDLRDNPGGYLDTVVNMLDYIAPKGTTIASFTNGYAKPDIAKTDHKVSLPSVVICNEGTASAGELFTSAIRDFSIMGHFPATIVGNVTYGKGIMQNTYLFSDNSSITLTVAYYNPPLGENYHGKGIEPNVKVELGDTGDTQLDAAYEEINKLINNQ